MNSNQEEEKDTSTLIDDSDNVVTVLLNDKDNQPTSPTPTVEFKLSGWSKHEKYLLLQAIKSYGSNCIADVTASIDTKTEEEVIKAIQFYKQKAVKMKAELTSTNTNLKKKRSGPKMGKPSHIPLGQWSQLLSDKLRFKDLHTDTAAALRLLAEFEDLPKPSYTSNNLDFKDLHLFIADAMEGKPLHMDNKTVAVMQKCLLETALYSKAFIKPSLFNQIVADLRISDGDLHTFPHPSSNIELDILRKLISDTSYNPLCVHENNLRPAQE